MKDVDSNRMTEKMQRQIKEDQCIKELDIKGLKFKYDKSEENILENLNIQLKQGEKILIRGKTGSGKTTLFKVLTGLYPEFSPIAKYFKEIYISFSPQKPLILPGDLK